MPYVVRVRKDIIDTRPIQVKSGPVRKKTKTMFLNKSFDLVDFVSSFFIITIGRSRHYLIQIIKEK